MSIPFSGRLSRSRGLISSIAKELKSLSLKPVQRIATQFDPFHESSKETRDFIFHISTPKIVATNPSCKVKTEIVHDQSEPKITFKLASGENVVMKCANLSSLNILQLYNKHITSLVEPVEKDSLAETQMQEKPVKRGRVKIKPYSKHRGVFL